MICLLSVTLRQCYKGNNIRKIAGVKVKNRGIVRLPDTDWIQLSQHNRNSTPIYCSNKSLQ